MHAGCSRLPLVLRDLLVDLLGLAALGAIADVVPLLGENRVIVRSGLTRIRTSPFIGLRALVKASGLDGDRIDTDGVGFSLAPRLNACGRLGHAREALELMLTDDPARAAEIARDLTRLNDSRRAVEKQIAGQALELASERGMLDPDSRSIVLSHPEWHTGVIGIVCSRLVERTGRPTILLQDQGDMLAGSGRSIDGYSLHAALCECAAHLHTFGGHDMAAGLKLSAGNLDAFRDAFASHASRLLNPEDLVPRVVFDCDASIRDLTPLAIRQLDLLAPFGRENSPVRVRLCGVRVSARPEQFGKAGGHIKLTLRDGERTLRVIGWNWAVRLLETAASIPVGTRIDALVIPKVSAWSGLVEPELVDLQPV
jgi:single-stranded-DNA-specific exonuclease